ncbi:MAG: hypothetical protein Q8Q11_03105 [bacterium]|nr:hypothetical protein [bacterium]MDZ4248416.1 hypothetical protein [Patescibacteria group bacterium]
MTALNAHFDRLKLAGVFYGTVVATLAATGSLELTATQAVLGGGALAASGVYYHHARRML